jgi:DNA mismatch repair ATPase MutL
MSSPTRKASRLFRDAADVFESFETTAEDVTVTHATPVPYNLIDQETVAVKVGVELPFFDHQSGATEPAAVFTPTDVRLRQDGSLYVELQATVGHTANEAGESDTPNRDSTMEPKQDEEPDETRNDTSASAPPESPPDEMHTNPNATTKTEATDKPRTESHDSEPSNKTSRKTTSQNGQDQIASDQKYHSIDREEIDEEEDADGEESNNPPYQDPEQLQAVYDEYDTFGEMTDALDVDVTPQTVRRYMIQYGIHETSNHPSETAQQLLDADPETLTAKQHESREATVPR